MTFANILASVAGKRPFWLYELQRDGEVGRFTSAGADIEWNSQTWTSTPVTHTRFMRTGAINRASTQLVFPASNVFAQRFLEPSYQGNLVIIRQGFSNDPDNEVVVRFRGRVIGVEPKLTRLVLTCENKTTQTRQKAMPAVMQRPCRHALYGDGCGLAIADWQVDATLTAYSDGVATVAAAASQPNGYYRYGVLEYAGRRQMIRAHSGSSLTLLGPIVGLEDDLAGSPGTLDVKIAPGCNLTRSVCNDRFGNILNFGGFPWMDETPWNKTNF